MRKTKLIFVLVCIFSLLMPSIVAAQGSYTKIEQGQKAPYSGYLLNELGLAKLMGKAEIAEKVCKIKIEHEQKSAEIEKKKVTAQHANEVKHLKARYEAVIKIKEEQLIKIENIAKNKKKGFLERFKDTSFWTGAAIGIGVGMAVTTAIILAARD